MADLSQVVGGLLRDLAKARFGSDLYARDVARYYEQDGLLRRFPPPRPEITEVEIDLKFLVGAVDLDATQHDLSEAILATVYEAYADRVTIAVVDALQRQPLPPDMGANARRGFVRIDVRKRVLKAMLDTWGRVAKPRPPPEVAQLAGKLAQELNEVLPGDLAWRESSTHEPPSDDTSRRDEAAKLAKAALDASAEEVRRHLAELASELVKASEDRADCRVEVEVGHERLSQAAPGAVSSIRVKAAIRNYVWTQVATEKGDQAWYALNPE
ncbi:MAG TPA: hypothetical protein VFP65_15150 [Anaeromyxobacteraceae bacterium]|nr:hypothetical protein [Anaeromyxobacteraceae bacterium]